MGRRTDSPRVEEAAGGLVARRDAGRPRILLIGQTDWRTRRRTTRLPKGKPEAGETPEETAVREVEEETGIRADVERELGVWRYAYYVPARGHYVHKRVRFYLMRPRAGTPRPRPGETLHVHWAPVAEALRTLTFDTEREVVRRARSLLA